MVFDLMRTETDDDVATDRAADGRRARRARRVPAEPAAGRRADGQVAAVRQVDKCARQGDDVRRAAGRSGLLHRARRPVEPGRLPRRGTDRGAGAAARPRRTGAYGELAEFLRTELRAEAPEKDAVGPGAVRPRLARLPRRHRGSRGDLRTGAGRSSSASRRSCARWRAGSRPDEDPRAAAKRARRRPAVPGDGPGGTAGLDAGPVRPGDRRHGRQALRHSRRRCAGWSA